MTTLLKSFLLLPVSISFSHMAYANPDDNATSIGKREELFTPLCVPRPIYIPWRTTRSYLNQYLKAEIPESSEGEALKTMRCRHLLRPCSSIKSFCGMGTERKKRRTLTVTDDKRNEEKLVLEFMEDETCTCMGESQYNSIYDPDDVVSPIVIRSFRWKRRSKTSMDNVTSVRKMEKLSTPSCVSRHIYIPWKTIRNYLNQHLKAEIPETSDGEALKTKRCHHLLTPSSSITKSFCGMGTERKKRRTLTVIDAKRNEEKLVLEFMEDKTCTCMGESQYNSIYDPDDVVSPIVIRSLRWKRRNKTRMGLVGTQSEEPESGCNPRKTFISWRKVRNYLVSYRRISIPGTWLGGHLEVMRCHDFLDPCKDKVSYCGVQAEERRNTHMLIYVDHRIVANLTLQFVQDKICQCIDKKPIVYDVEKLPVISDANFKVYR